MNNDYNELNEKKLKQKDSNTDFEIIAGESAYVDESSNYFNSTDIYGYKSFIQQASEIQIIYSSHDNLLSKTSLNISPKYFSLISNIKDDVKGENVQIKLINISSDSKIWILFSENIIHLENVKIKNSDSVIMIFSPKIKIINSSFSGKTIIPNSFFGMDWEPDLNIDENSVTPEIKKDCKISEKNFKNILLSEGKSSYTKKIFTERNHSYKDNNIHEFIKSVSEIIKTTLHSHNSTCNLENFSKDWAEKTQFSSKYELNKL